MLFESNPPLRYLLTARPRLRDGMVADRLLFQEEALVWMMRIKLMRSLKGQTLG